MKDSFKATVNDQFDFDLSSDNPLDIIEWKDGIFHVIHNNQTYKAEVISSDYSAKTISLKLNGDKYQIKLADQYDQLIKKLGLSAVNTNKVNSVKAPMPGLVLDIAVEIGQRVEKEDGLIILEAMKMENVIKSIGEGTVKAIHVEKGAAVDKGQLLIEMD